MRKSLSITLLAVTTSIGAHAVAANTPAQYGDISPDGHWLYVGGDSGWAPAPHRLVSRGGQWVHDDTLVHDSARPAPPTMQDRLRQIGRPGGSPHMLERRGGEWVHVDSLDHDSPRPAPPTMQDRLRQIGRPGGVQ